MRSPFFATIAVALLCVSSSVFAQVPDSLSFQGRLTDTNGDAVADGNYNLLMRMYKGSSKIWEQSHISVPVKSGLFNVILTGTMDYPLDTVAFNAPIDLGIVVNGGTEMTPRTPLTSAAYALGMRGLYAVQADDVVGNSSYNVIGGASNNFVASGVVGATIGGGCGMTGSTPVPNSVLDYFATVGGGARNTASGIYATVSGGQVNTATGRGATVPGGFGNSARGSDSFAAGFLAKAVHDGTFVWNGRRLGTNDSLVSTGTNQFFIRAARSVGIGTNSPTAALHLVGRFQLGSIEYFEDGGAMNWQPTRPFTLHSVQGPWVLQRKNGLWFTPLTARSKRRTVD